MAVSKVRVASKLWLPEEGGVYRSTVTQTKGVTVTRQSVREYLARQRDRYVAAPRAERGRRLDEIAAVTGYHRKPIIRALVPGRPPARGGGRWAGRDAATLGPARKYHRRPGGSVRLCRRGDNAARAPGPASAPFVLWLGDLTIYQQHL